MIGDKRRAVEVVDLLRQRMDEIVGDYSDGVRRIKEPINGTAFFPGGDGLWRGDEPRGDRPDWFPPNAIMFVGHNFDSVKGYERSLKRGIEVMKWPTWRNLRQYIHYAGISEQQCFFTNALMGLQPDRSQGTLSVTPRFRDECLSFLCEQIDIVRPAAIVVLGKVSTEHVFQVPRAVPKLALLHPRAATRRRELVAEMGNRLGAFITASGSGSVHP